MGCVTNVGNGFGPGTSTSRSTSTHWPSFAGSSLPAHIGRRDSAICPHCQGAEETVEHLVFQCPAHDQARRDTWSGDIFTTDLRRLWSYLKRIGLVTPPLTGNERDIGVCSPGLTDSNSHVHSMLLLTPVSSEPMLTFYAHSYCLILYGR